MIGKLTVLYLMGVICGTPATVAWAQGVAVTECDRLAAEADDAERTAPGVSDAALDPTAAIPACDRAIEQSPHRRLLFQLGRAHLKAENLTVAFIRLQAAAEQGHVLAQTYVGTLYLDGTGAPRDATRAAAWFRKAAEQGDSVAQFNIATLYETGRGLAKDLGQAATWYRRSADQGFGLAQVSLGRMYAAGLGVPRDLRQATEWYRKAADQGYPGAAERLAALQAASPPASAPRAPMPAEPAPQTAQAASPAAPAAWTVGALAATAGAFVAGDWPPFRIAVAAVGAAMIVLAVLLMTRRRKQATARSVERQLASLKAESRMVGAGGTAEPLFDFPDPLAAQAVAAQADAAQTDTPAGEAEAPVTGGAVTAEAVVESADGAAPDIVPVLPGETEEIQATDDTTTDDETTDTPARGSANVLPFAAELEAIPPHPRQAAEAEAAEAETPDSPAPLGAPAGHAATEAGSTAAVPAPVAPAVVVKRCSQCQKEIPVNDYFCCHCGALAIRFSECQHDTREDARFCPRCGAILRWASQKTAAETPSGALAHG